MYNVKNFSNFVAYTCEKQQFVSLPQVTTCDMYYYHQYLYQPNTWCNLFVENSLALMSLYNSDFQKIMEVLKSLYLIIDVCEIQWLIVNKDN